MWVWAVTKGCYDDYSVEALFAVEADAEAAVDAGLGNMVEKRRFYAAGEKPQRVEHWYAAIWDSAAIWDTENKVTRPEVDVRVVERWDCNPLPPEKPVITGVNSPQAHGSTRESVVQAVLDAYNKRNSKV